MSTNDVEYNWLTDDSEVPTDVSFRQDIPALTADFQDDGLSPDQPDYYRLRVAKLLNEYDKYVLRRETGAWDFEVKMSRTGIIDYLVQRGLSTEDAATFVNSRMCTSVMGKQMAPNRPAIFQEEVGRYFCNAWMAPTLQAEPGDFSRITRVVSWLANHNQEQIDGLMRWLSFVVKNPGIRPNTGVLLLGIEGSGKGTLVDIMFMMLGVKNCRYITAEQFVKGWGGEHLHSLFTFVDELENAGQSPKDLANFFKPLITSDTSMDERKGVDTRSVPNRTAWMAASNHENALVITPSDRRWNVFSNFTPKETVLPGHEGSHFDFLVSLRGGHEDNKEFNDGFLAEIAAFKHHLLQMTVSRKEVQTPVVAESKMRVFEVSKPVAELLMDDVNAAENPLEFLAGLIERSNRPLYTGLPSKAAMREELIHRPRKNDRHYAILPSKHLTSALQQYAAEEGHRREQVPGKKAWSRALANAGWAEARSEHVRGFLWPASALSKLEKEED